MMDHRTTEAPDQINGHPRAEDDLVGRLRMRPDSDCRQAADEIERLRSERLKLDKRVHNQRVALRQTWEIVEMRRKWLGSDTARRMYGNLLKRYRALKASAVSDDRSAADEQKVAR